MNQPTLPIESHPSGFVALLARPVLGLVLAGAMIVVCIALAYANSLHNGFHFDDGYGIELNPWIRSLSNIPRYFIDADTLTTNRQNADYRPILQITYALNYTLSGYDPWSWRLVQLCLHAIVSTGLFALGRAVIGSRRVATISSLSPGDGDIASLLGAMVFAIHPITTGACDWIWARSTLLTAAFLVPATVLLLRALARRGSWTSYAAPVLLYALALLTKGEAISFVGVSAAAIWLLDPKTQDRSLWSRLLSRELWLRWAPFLALSAGYVALRQTVVPKTLENSSGAVTAYPYLLTQFRAWWYYLTQIAAPVNQIVDYGSYPVSTSILEPRVVLALAGWVAVCVLILAAARRAPAAAFCAICFFMYLGPHSSFVPLAEMVNEHRPYIAVSALFLLIAAAALIGAKLASPYPRTLTLVLALLIALPLGYLTHERNKVWLNEYTLWEDTVEKDPANARAQMNMGVQLMQLGKYADAERHFRETIRLSPTYHYAFTNLGIVLAAQGNDVAACAAFDRSVELGPNSDSPYYWRGRYRAKTGDLKGAISDFRAAVDRTGGPLKELAALVECLTKAGDFGEAERVAQRGVALDPTGFAADRAAFREQVFPPPKAK